MPLEDRQEQIIALLLDQESVSVAELSDYFQVSPVTIRNDLQQLADAGRIIRTHGGARISNGRTQQEYSFTARQRTNAEAKRAIGLLAAQLVEPGEAILLDASTTAVAVAQALKQRTELSDITVVTTGIWTALELLGTDRFNVVLSGGYVRNVTGSITGLITNEILSRFNFQKAFLGARGITPKEGLTDAPLVEVELKLTIVPRCQEVIAIVDGNKFGKVAVASFAPVSHITRIITDASAPEAMVQVFQQQGIEVLVASRELG